MFRNYFKIAVRNLWRNKGVSSINLSGLAIGIATCLIILLFVRSELSYDRYNVKADRMVRVTFRGSSQGGEMKEANVMPPVAQTLLKDYPEVEEATRLQRGSKYIVRYQDRVFSEKGFAYVDSNFFQVFTLPLEEGDARTALIEPNTVVITREIAQKYFGKEDPVGKVLSVKGWKTDLKVTGVIDKVPVNSHFHFDFFVSLVGSPDAVSASWMTSGFNTYLVLKPGYDYKKLNAKLPQVVEKYIGPQLLQGMGMSLAEFRRKGNDIGLYLQPLEDIHLHSDYTNDLEAPGDVHYVYISASIAGFMLLIACINFMNLSTAGASRRSREVGIRKVLGSMRAELVKQFLLESLLLTAIALLLAIGIVYLALPGFNSLAGKRLELSFRTTPWLVPALVLFGLLTGILAGTYPAFFLSSFKPVSVLKGRLSSGKKSIGFRSALVVFQFFISIGLIICTAVVYDQLNYIQHKKLGYDKDQVMVLPETWMLGNKGDAFNQAVQQDPRVVSISFSDYLPAGPSDGNNFFVYPEHDNTHLVKTLRYDIDYNYIPTMGMKIETGRNFDRNFGTDSSGVILNETAIRVFGWEKDPLGHTITNTDNDGHKYSFRVVGVVKDFHFRSFRERISPLVMVLSTRPGTMIVKTRTRDITGFVASMRKIWSSFTPEAPLEYSFLDERFNNTYLAEQKTALILGIFAALTIFVASLGLFGLATFTAEQRTKEIGIRKVLGASVTGIVSLLSADFLKLVCIAFLIAVPLAFYMMNKWLQDYEYRVQISWWLVFGGAALLTVAVTLITISFRSIRAALANPVDSLRSE
ncbi:MAG: ABC transporter permease [Puia sp.]|nr:ABC transporter permease [Puia sp.]